MRCCQVGRAGYLDSWWQLEQVDDDIDHRDDDHVDDNDYGIIDHDDDDDNIDDFDED